MQAADARPPYVTFEVRGEEDRAASIEAGHFVAKDVVYAIITPQGSKDRIERLAKDWLENMQAEVQSGRFPAEWLVRFKEMYKAWEEGRELPLSGTSVTQWPAASPAQVKQLQTVHIRTVEDLATCNEETLNRLGMGGRALKQKAVEWLAASKNVGKVAEEMASLKTLNAGLLERNSQLEAQLRDLSARVDALAPAKKP